MRKLVGSQHRLRDALHVEASQGATMAMTCRGARGRRIYRQSD